MQLHRGIIWITVKGTHMSHCNGCFREEKQCCRPCHVFSCFLAVLLELNNPGYSHYKSCCLDLRLQTGDRLCNLVSFSIPLGFTGRCLTLLAGYLLATLKATFLLTSQLGTYTYNVCTVDARAHSHMHEKTNKDVPYMQPSKTDNMDA